MASIIKGHRTVANEREIVVFPIGVRINRAWKLQKWLPAFRAMPRMLAQYHVSCVWITLIVTGS